MIYLIIVLTFSFLLEGIFSNMVSMTSLLIPLFTIVALVNIYPYFRKYDSLFFQICIGCGFCYDIIYTNTVCIHAVLFLGLGYFISFGYHFLSVKIWNVTLILLLSIVGYRIMSFGLLTITGFIPFDVVRLRESLISSFFSNFIFGILLYGILHLFRKWKKIELYH